MMMRVSGDFSMTVPMAAITSPGMERSMVITSGCRASASSTAPSAEVCVPTISKAGLASNKVAMPINSMG